MSSQKVIPARGKVADRSQGKSSSPYLWVFLP
jgi:hypothetical protein